MRTCPHDPKYCTCFGPPPPDEFESADLCMAFAVLNRIFVVERGVIVAVRGVGDDPAEALDCLRLLVVELDEIVN